MTNGEIVLFATGGGGPGIGIQEVRLVEEFADDVAEISTDHPAYAELEKGHREFAAFFEKATRTEAIQCNALILLRAALRDMSPPDVRSDIWPEWHELQVDCCRLCVAVFLSTAFAALTRAEQAFMQKRLLDSDRW